MSCAALKTYPFITSFIYFSAFAFIQSCQISHYLYPQPVDQKNIENFPKAFRGQWSEEEQQDEGGEGSFFLISKKNAAIIIHGTDTIIKGAWPRKDNNGTYMPPPPFIKAFSTINYDSLKNPVDTVANYLIKDSLIFRMEGSQGLSKGYRFYITGDSIILLQKDTNFIDLGKNAFLRKLNSRFYMLNVRNRVLGESWAEANDWWQLNLIETTGKSSFNIWDQTEKFKELPYMVLLKDTAFSSDYFYDCRWTTNELLRLIKEGYFEAGSMFFKQDD